MALRSMAEDNGEVQLEEFKHRRWFKREATEEDDLKDLEALLNKKSFKELQKSKTGEELLDLIHRPTVQL
ncbi:hypothetical protein L2E82_42331 [Cichorium intybus]|uniref:Uncharacterized protein n=1 Tax=Cichorium intybus TaxID=13427 RepID=A0ACB8ZMS9_CICIN|nr:hypothetical protein L2E82_42331 [Cichorium intybus]